MKKQEIISYAQTPSDKLDELLAKQYKMEDDCPTAGHRSYGGAGVQRTYATTNWSNLDFIQLCIAEYDVLNDQIPQMKKVIDVFEFIMYCWLVLEQRLLAQEELRDLFDSTDRDPSRAVLQTAVLPKPVVVFMESLAPVISPDGTKLIFAPYECQQVQGGGQQAMTAANALVAGAISHRAARTVDVITQQAVNNGAQAAAARGCVYRLIQEVDNAAAGAVITPANANQWFGYPVFLRSYKKRPDHLVSYVNGGVLVQGTHFPAALQLNGAMRYGYQNPLFEDFNTYSWSARKVTMMSIKVYDAATADFSYSYVTRRTEIIASPFIYLAAHVANIAGMLDILQLPRYTGYRAVAQISLYDKHTRLKDSLRTKDCSGLIQDIKSAVNLDF